MEKKDDDEISIDFGKIKGWFKGKDKPEHTQTESQSEHNAPKEEKPAHHEHKKETDHSHHSAHEAKTSQDDSQNKDDEIAIDFSKIKNIFKKEKKEHTTKEQHSHGHEKKQGNDDEISIDFSKLKNVFRIEKEKKDIRESGDDIAIDFGKIQEFSKKYATVLLVLIPIFLAIFLRAVPASLPITDEWAQNSVYNSIRSQIKSQIDQQYPNLPEQNKQTLVETEFEKVRKERKVELDQQVKATSDFFRSKLQDDSGQTYLVGIDPEYWAQHSKNIISHGHPGDILVDGKPYDTHMLAPTGRLVPYDMFHSYLIAYTYEFLDIFGQPSLLSVVFYNPVWLCALIVIPAFFVTRKIAGNFGGLIAGIIVAIHPAFLTRTAGGFADTDPYNLLFPLLITWMYVEALDAKDLKRTGIFATIAGILSGFYSLAWSGWWYIFDFLIAASIGYLLYYTWMHRREVKDNIRGFLKKNEIGNSVAFLAVFFVASAISVSLFVNFGEFTNFANGPFAFAKLKEVGIRNIWPNVYTTVAEQNPASLSSVISQTGLGKPLFFFIGIFGISLTLMGKGLINRYFILGSAAWYALIFYMKIQTLYPFLILISVPIIIRIVIALVQDDSEVEIKYTLLLFFWLVATVYASVKGVRYIMLVIPPFAIGFGLVWNTFYTYVSSFITKNLNINRLLSAGAVIVLVLIVLGMLPVPFNPFHLRDPSENPFCIGAICKGSYSIARNEIPNFSDEWRISLERIRDDSEPNGAIITSWWDFGHWFKYWADRPVTFDGTTQNTAMAHWVGLALLTENEKQAVAMLRMLDCAGRDGYTLINNKSKDPFEAVQTTKQIIMLSKKNAKKALENKGFSEQEADAVLEKTHCDNPPKAYFITSEDMIGKSGVWAHFGSWDFERAFIYNTLKHEDYQNNRQKSLEFLEQRLDYSKEKAEQVYSDFQGIVTSEQANNWIAPWPGYAGENGCSRTEDILSCGNGFIINLTSHEAFAQSQQGIIRPKKIAFPENNTLVLKEYNESIFSIGNGRQLGLALVQNGESYTLVQMDSDQTASMFTRMFFQEGIGLTYFKKFSDERTIFGGRVIVWKVDWDVYFEDAE